MKVEGGFYTEMQQINTSQNISKMELPKSLSDFMQLKEKKILAFAQRNTEEVVKTELALLDFELLLAVNSNKDKREDTFSRSLRVDSWQELSQKFDGDYNKINSFLKDF